MNIHEKYIKRCIELAKNGFGRTYPNPMVGCVIVNDGKIIGEGWHQKAGEAHAEVNAINAVSDKSLLKKATLYVSLEPCSHHGRTPPCSDLIVYHGIPEVIIGSVDPNEKVAGKGIEKLRNGGCKVTVGVLEKECVELNARFFTYHLKKRPYIILKWAQTADGYIDRNRAVLNVDEAHPTWIANTYSRQLTHKWRTEEQAILVGTTTALKDNPSLTARDWKGNNPIRVILDRTLKIPSSYHVLDGTVKTLVITGKQVVSNHENIDYCMIDFSKNVAAQICEVLYENEIQSLIVEGGLQTLQTFISSGLWDEARIFTANITFGSGVKSPVMEGETIYRTGIKGDVLEIIRNSI